ncbi:hypothetical protein UFOVP232_22 [uncultured Caudovirales phage]|uniref:Uncharacterized protein n=1 Tax=uncultured Caudovirales phage TaxID=2100421 RepID=A0A6J7WQF9_9CAUD|nr:hypothetical protein UFOVP232_22 [uncultured Caudovirales phage]
MSNDLILNEIYVHKNGKMYDVAWYYDSDFGAPGDESDCHGVTVRMDWNPTNKEQLEQHIADEEPDLEEETRLRMMRLLCRPSNRYDSGLYYDVMASLETARKEWGHTDPDAAMAAVEQDFAYLKGWYDEEWYWVTLGVAPFDENNDVDEDAREYCGGYESTIIWPRNDEERAWREECINDKIAEVEWQLRKQRHPGQMELAL